MWISEQSISSNNKRNLWIKTGRSQLWLFIQSFQDLLSETDRIFSEAKSYWFHRPIFQ
jgi:hypothetical protein